MEKRPSPHQFRRNSRNIFLKNPIHLPVNDFQRIERETSEEPVIEIMVVNRTEEEEERGENDYHDDYIFKVNDSFSQPTFPKTRILPGESPLDQLAGSEENAIISKKTIDSFPDATGTTSTSKNVRNQMPKVIDEQPCSFLSKSKACSAEGYKRKRHITHEFETNKFEKIEENSDVNSNDENQPAIARIANGLDFAEEGITEIDGSLLAPRNPKVSERPAIVPEMELDDGVENSNQLEILDPILKKKIMSSMIIPDEAEQIAEKNKKLPANSDESVYIADYVEPIENHPNEVYQIDVDRGRRKIIDSPSAIEERKEHSDDDNGGRQIDPTPIDYDRIFNTQEYNNPDDLQYEDIYQSVNTEEQQQYTGGLVKRDESTTGIWQAFNWPKYEESQFKLSSSDDDLSGSFLEKNNNSAYGPENSLRTSTVFWKGFNWPKFEQFSDSISRKDNEVITDYTVTNTPSTKEDFRWKVTVNAHPVSGGGKNKEDVPLLRKYGQGSSGRTRNPFDSIWPEHMNYTAISKDRYTIKDMNYMIKNETQIHSSDKLIQGYMSGENLRASTVFWKGFNWPKHGNYSDSISRNENEVLINHPVTTTRPLSEEFKWRVSAHSNSVFEGTGKKKKLPLLGKYELDSSGHTKNPFDFSWPAYMNYENLSSDRNATSKSNITIENKTEMHSSGELIQKNLRTSTVFWKGFNWPKHENYSDLISRNENEVLTNNLVTTTGPLSEDFKWRVSAYSNSVLEGTEEKKKVALLGKYRLDSSRHKSPFDFSWPAHMNYKNFSSDENTTRESNLIIEKKTQMHSSDELIQQNLRTSTVFWKGFNWPKQENYSDSIFRNENEVLTNNLVTTTRPLSNDFKWRVTANSNSAFGGNAEKKKVALLGKYRLHSSRNTKNPFDFSWPAHINYKNFSSDRNTTRESNIAIENKTHLHSSHESIQKNLRTSTVFWKGFNWPKHEIYSDSISRNENEVLTNNLVTTTGPLSKDFKWRVSAYSNSVLEGTEEKKKVALLGKYRQDSSRQTKNPFYFSWPAHMNYKNVSSNRNKTNESTIIIENKTQMHSSDELIQQNLRTATVFWKGFNWPKHENYSDSIFRNENEVLTNNLVTTTRPLSKDFKWRVTANSNSVFGGTAEKKKVALLGKYRLDSSRHTKNPFDLSWPEHINYKNFSSDRNTTRESNIVIENKTHLHSSDELIQKNLRTSTVLWKGFNWPKHETYSDSISRNENNLVTTTGPLSKDFKWRVTAYSNSVFEGTEEKKKVALLGKYRQDSSRHTKNPFDFSWPAHMNYKNVSSNRNTTRESTIIIENKTQMHSIDEFMQRTSTVFYEEFTSPKYENYSDAIFGKENGVLRNHLVTTTSPLPKEFKWNITVNSNQVFEGDGKKEKIPFLRKDSSGYTENPLSFSWPVQTNYKGVSSDRNTTKDLTSILHNKTRIHSSHELIEEFTSREKILGTSTESWKGFNWPKFENYSDSILQTSMASTTEEDFKWNITANENSLSELNKEAERTSLLRKYGHVSFGHTKIPFSLNWPGHAKYKDFSSNRNITKHLNLITYNKIGTPSSDQLTQKFAKLENNSRTSTVSWKEFNWPRFDTSFDANQLAATKEPSSKDDVRWKTTLNAPQVFQENEEKEKVAPLRNYGQGSTEKPLSFSWPVHTNYGDFLSHRNTTEELNLITNNKTQIHSSSELVQTFITEKTTEKTEIYPKLINFSTFDIVTKIPSEEIQQKQETSEIWKYSNWPENHSFSSDDKLHLPSVEWQNLKITENTNVKEETYTREFNEGEVDVYEYNPKSEEQTTKIIEKAFGSDELTSELYDSEKSEHLWALSPTEFSFDEENQLLKEIPNNLGTSLTNSEIYKKFLKINSKVISKKRGKNILGTERKHLESTWNDFDWLRQHFNENNQKINISHNTFGENETKILEEQLSSPWKTFNWPGHEQYDYSKLSTATFENVTPFDDEFAELRWTEKPSTTKTEFLEQTEFPYGSTEKPMEIPLEPFTHSETADEKSTVQIWKGFQWPKNELIEYEKTEINTFSSEKEKASTKMSNWFEQDVTQNSNISSKRSSTSYEDITAQFSGAPNGTSTIETWTKSEKNLYEYEKIITEKQKFTTQSEEEARTSEQLNFDTDWDNLFSLDINTKELHTTIAYPTKFTLPPTKWTTKGDKVELVEDITNFKQRPEVNETTRIKGPSKISSDFSFNGQVKESEDDEGLWNFRILKEGEIATHRKRTKKPFFGKSKIYNFKPVGTDDWEEFNEPRDERLRTEIATTKRSETTFYVWLSKPTVEEPIKNRTVPEEDIMEVSSIGPLTHASQETSEPFKSTNVVELDTTTLETPISIELQPQLTSSSEMNIGSNEIDETTLKLDIPDLTELPVKISFSPAETEQPEELQTEKTYITQNLVEDNEALALATEEIEVSETRSEFASQKSLFQIDDNSFDKHKLIPSEIIESMERSKNNTQLSEIDMISKDFEGLKLGDNLKITFTEGSSDKDLATAFMEADFLEKTTSLPKEKIKDIVEAERIIESPESTYIKAHDHERTSWSEELHIGNESSNNYTEEDHINTFSLSLENTLATNIMLTMEQLSNKMNELLTENSVDIISSPALRNEEISPLVVSSIEKSQHVSEIASESPQSMEIITTLFEQGSDSIDKLLTEIDVNSLSSQSLMNEETLPRFFPLVEISPYASGMISETPISTESITKFSEQPPSNIDELLSEINAYINSSLALISEEISPTFVASVAISPYEGETVSQSPQSTESITDYSEQLSGNIDELLTEINAHINSSIALTSEEISLTFVPSVAILPHISDMVTESPQFTESLTESSEQLSGNIDELLSEINTHINLNPAPISDEISLTFVPSVATSTYESGTVSESPQSAKSITDSSEQLPADIDELLTEINIDIGGLLTEINVQMNSSPALMSEELSLTFIPSVAISPSVSKTVSESPQSTESITVSSEQLSGNIEELLTEINAHINSSPELMSEEILLTFVPSVSISPYVIETVSESSKSTESITESSEQLSGNIDELLTEINAHINSSPALTSEEISLTFVPSVTISPYVSETVSESLQSTESIANSSEQLSGSIDELLTEINAHINSSPALTSEEISLAFVPSVAISPYVSETVSESPQSTISITDFSEQSSGNIDELLTEINAHIYSSPELMSEEISLAFIPSVTISPYVSETVSELPKSTESITESSEQLSANIDEVLTEINAHINSIPALMSEKIPLTFVPSVAISPYVSETVSESPQSTESLTDSSEPLSGNIDELSTKVNAHINWSPELMSEELSLTFAPSVTISSYVSETVSEVPQSTESITDSSEQLSGNIDEPSTEINAHIYSSPELMSEKISLTFVPSVTISPYVSEMVSELPQSTESITDSSEQPSGTTNEILTEVNVELNSRPALMIEEISLTFVPSVAISTYESRTFSESPQSTESITDFSEHLLPDNADDILTEMNVELTSSPSLVNEKISSILIPSVEISPYVVQTVSELPLSTETLIYPSKQLFSNLDKPSTEINVEMNWKPTLVHEEISSMNAPSVEISSVSKTVSESPQSTDKILDFSHDQLSGSIDGRSTEINEVTNSSPSLMNEEISPTFGPSLTTPPYVIETVSESRSTEITTDFRTPHSENDFHNFAHSGQIMNEEEELENNVFHLSEHPSDFATICEICDETESTRIQHQHTIEKVHYEMTEKAGGKKFNRLHDEEGAGVEEIFTIPKETIPKDFEGVTKISIMNNFTQPMTMKENEEDIDYGVLHLRDKVHEVSTICEICDEENISNLPKKRIDITDNPLPQSLLTNEIIEGDSDLPENEIENDLLHLPQKDQQETSTICEICSEVEQDLISRKPKLLLATQHQNLISEEEYDENQHYVPEVKQEHTSRKPKLLPTTQHQKVISETETEHGPHEASSSSETISKNFEGMTKMSRLNNYTQPMTLKQNEEDIDYDVLHLQDKVHEISTICQICDEEENISNLPTKPIENTHNPLPQTRNEIIGDSDHPENEIENDLLHLPQKDQQETSTICEICSDVEHDHTSRKPKLLLTTQHQTLISGEEYDENQHAPEVKQEYTSRKPKLLLTTQHQKLISEEEYDENQHYVPEVKQEHTSRKPKLLLTTQHQNLISEEEYDVNQHYVPEVKQEHTSRKPKLLLTTQHQKLISEEEYDENQHYVPEVKQEHTSRKPKLLLTTQHQNLISEEEYDENQHYVPEVKQEHTSRKPKLLLTTQHQKLISEKEYDENQHYVPEVKQEHTSRKPKLLPTTQHQKVISETETEHGPHEASSSSETISKDFEGMTKISWIKNFTQPMTLKENDEDFDYDVLHLLDKVHEVSTICEICDEKEYISNLPTKPIENTHNPLPQTRNEIIGDSDRPENEIENDLLHLPQKDQQETSTICEICSEVEHDHISRKTKLLLTTQHQKLISETETEYGPHEVSSSSETISKDFEGMTKISWINNFTQPMTLKENEEDFDYDVLHLLDKVHEVSTICQICDEEENISNLPTKRIESTHNSLPQTRNEIIGESDRPEDEIEKNLLHLPQKDQQETSTICEICSEVEQEHTSRKPKLLTTQHQNLTMFEKFKHRTTPLSVVHNFTNGYEVFSYQEYSEATKVNFPFVEQENIDKESYGTETSSPHSNRLLLPYKLKFSKGNIGYTTKQSEKMETENEREGEVHVVADQREETSETVSLEDSRRLSGEPLLSSTEYHSITESKISGGDLESLLIGLINRSDEKSTAEHIFSKPKLAGSTISFGELEGFEQSEGPVIFPTVHRKENEKNTLTYISGETNTETTVYKKTGTHQDTIDLLNPEYNIELSSSKKPDETKYSRTSKSSATEKESEGTKFSKPISIDTELQSQTEDELENNILHFPQKDQHETQTICEICSEVEDRTSMRPSPFLTSKNARKKKIHLLDETTTQRFHENNVEVKMSTEDVGDEDESIMFHLPENGRKETSTLLSTSTAKFQEDLEVSKSTVGQAETNESITATYIFEGMEINRPLPTKNLNIILFNEQPTTHPEVKYFTTASRADFPSHYFNISAKEKIIYAELPSDKNVTTQNNQVELNEIEQTSSSILNGLLVPYIMNKIRKGWRHSISGKKEMKTENGKEHKFETLTEKNQHHSETELEISSEMVETKGEYQKFILRNPNLETSETSISMNLMNNSDKTSEIAKQFTPEKLPKIEFASSSISMFEEEEEMLTEIEVSKTSEMPAFFSSSESAEKYINYPSVSEKITPNVFTEKPSVASTEFPGEKKNLLLLTEFVETENSVTSIASTTEVSIAAQNTEVVNSRIMLTHEIEKEKTNLEDIGIDFEMDSSTVTRMTLFQGVVDESALNRVEGSTGIENFIGQSKDLLISNEMNRETNELDKVVNEIMTSPLSSIEQVITLEEELTEINTVEDELEKELGDLQEVVREMLRTTLSPDEILGNFSNTSFISEYDLQSETTKSNIPFMKSFIGSTESFNELKFLSSSLEGIESKLGYSEETTPISLSVHETNPVNTKLESSTQIKSSFHTEEISTKLAHVISEESEYSYLSNEIDKMLEDLEIVETVSSPGSIEVVKTTGVIVGTEKTLQEEEKKLEVNYVEFTTTTENTEEELMDITESFNALKSSSSSVEGVDDKLKKFVEAIKISSSIHEKTPQNTTLKSSTEGKSSTSRSNTEEISTKLAHVISEESENLYLEEIDEMLQDSRIVQTISTPGSLEFLKASEVMVGTGKILKEEEKVLRVNYAEFPTSTESTEELFMNITESFNELKPSSSSFEGVTGKLKNFVEATIISSSIHEKESENTTLKYSTQRKSSTSSFNMEGISTKLAHVISEESENVYLSNEIDEMLQDSIIVHTVSTPGLIKVLKTTVVTVDTGNILEGEEKELRLNYAEFPTTAENTEELFMNITESSNELKSLSSSFEDVKGKLKNFVEATTISSIHEMEPQNTTLKSLTERKSSISSFHPEEISTEIAHNMSEESENSYLLNEIDEILEDLEALKDISTTKQKVSTGNMLQEEEKVNFDEYSTTNIYPEIMSTDSRSFIQSNVYKTFSEGQENTITTAHVSTARFTHFENTEELETFPSSENMSGKFLKLNISLTQEEEQKKSYMEENAEQLFLATLVENNTIKPDENKYSMTSIPSLMEQSLIKEMEGEGKGVSEPISTDTEIQNKSEEELENNMLHLPENDQSETQTICEICSEAEDQTSLGFNVSQMTSTSLLTELENEEQIKASPPPGKIPGKLIYLNKISSAHEEVQTSSYSNEPEQLFMATLFENNTIENVTKNSAEEYELSGATPLNENYTRELDETFTSSYPKTPAVEIISTIPFLTTLLLSLVASSTQHPKEHTDVSGHYKMNPQEPKCIVVYLSGENSNHAVISFNGSKWVPSESALSAEKEITTSVYSKLFQMPQAEEEKGTAEENSLSTTELYVDNGMSSETKQVSPTTLKYTGAITDNSNFIEGGCSEADFENNNYCFCMLDLTVDHLAESLQASNSSEINNVGCFKFLKVNTGLIIKNETSFLQRKKRSYLYLRYHNRKRREVVEYNKLDEVIENELVSQSTETKMFRAVGSCASIPCVYRNEMVEREHFMKYVWTSVEGKLVSLSDRVRETTDGVLKISEVTISDGGNYTCSVSRPFGNTDSEQKSFVHELIIIERPIFKIKTTIMYDTEEACSLKQGDIIHNFLPSLLEDLLCGLHKHVCRVEMERPSCIQMVDKTYLTFKYIVTLDPLPSLLPSLSYAKCDFNCQMKIYGSLVSLLIKNVETTSFLNIISEMKSFNHTFKPKEVKFPTDRKAVDDTTLLPKLIIGCPPGFGIQRSTNKLCVACARNSYSSDNSSSCNPCPFIQFQPNLGSTSCIECKTPFEDKSCVGMVLANKSFLIIYIGSTVAIIFLILLCVFCAQSVGTSPPVKKKKSHTPKRRRIGRRDIEDPAEKTLLLKDPNIHKVIKGPKVPPPDF